jgi:hypothetical protein
MLLTTFAAWPQSQNCARLRPGRSGQYAMYCHAWLLRLRHLRAARSWGWRRSALRRQARYALLQFIEHAAIALIEGGQGRRPCRRFLSRGSAGIDDRSRMALKACQPRQGEAGGEKSCRKQSGGARQDVGRAAARQESARRADETATLGFLQQHHADQRDNQHKMDDNDNSQHSRMSVSTLLRARERPTAALIAVT